MAITKTEIKTLIKESLDNALNDYFATNGKYIIEGIIRESLGNSLNNIPTKSQLNPLQEAQMMVGNQTNINTQPQQRQPTGNPYGGAFGDILKQTANRGINFSDMVDHSTGI